MANPKILDATVTTREACDLLGISRTWLKNVAADGHMSKAGPNAWRLGDVVRGYIKYLQDGERRASRSAADSRIQDARAFDITARTQARLAGLVVTDDAVSVIRDVIAGVREDSVGAGARACADHPDVAVAVDRDIQDLLDRAETRLAEMEGALRAGTSSPGRGRPWNS
jgi:hypothetical protein